MKPGATFDSSFWVHAAYLDILGFLFHDYELYCARSVEKEMGETNPTGLRLKSALRDGWIQRIDAKRGVVKLYGEGERAAMNLALERKLILLIDDWKPYQTALELEIEVVNTPIYVICLNRQNRVADERALELLARLIKRGTIKPAWISAALEMIASQRKEREDK